MVIVIITLALVIQAGQVYFYTTQKLKIKSGEKNLWSSSTYSYGVDISTKNSNTDSFILITKSEDGTGTWIYPRDCLDVLGLQPPGAESDDSDFQR